MSKPAQLSQALLSTALLSIENVTHSFVDPHGHSQTVLSEFSLHLQRGESVALWGPSGSGKTTLLNLVAGLLRPDSGKITLKLSKANSSAADSARRKTVDDLQIDKLTDEGLLDYRKAHVGYVFQFFNLIETLTVSENVRLALELADKLESFKTYLPRFEQLGLGDLIDRFPAELSGGEQQRVAVLRALAHEPALVLADEPTGNLDRKNSERVADLLWQQVKEQNAALLIATHSDAIAQRADRVIETG